ncbi:hypothetical protein EI42_03166 [Thermosporothrix hazakensis]|jgi:hypothetical protein|uniref:Uncharacterized protein n=1 Tax=Thermosporothrix hazakensis TaxID=644383 RepID=A0A326U570_THEHA|nr:hypothetical protein [Thermosporothrix hazakensis]PZW28412.1 hypothetical protein EI42_03166 [Thermosporothrix hazakensis]GCE45192.1 hypothetical protein KTH_00610 [Thermosporothrix hazakensis]
MSSDAYILGKLAGIIEEHTNIKVEQIHETPLFYYTEGIKKLTRDQKGELIAKLLKQLPKDLNLSKPFTGERSVNFWLGYYHEKMKEVTGTQREPGEIRRRKPDPFTTRHTIRLTDKEKEFVDARGGSPYIRFLIHREMAQGKAENNQEAGGS